MNDFFNKLQLLGDELDSIHKYKVSKELEQKVNEIIPNLFFRIEFTNRFEQIIIYVPKQYVDEVRKIIRYKGLGFFHGSTIRWKKKNLESILLNISIRVVGE